MLLYLVGHKTREIVPFQRGTWGGGLCVIAVQELGSLLGRLASAEAVFNIEANAKAKRIGVTRGCSR